jgi:pimeloyl-ACP methyl ester carboxylesterase
LTLAAATGLCPFSPAKVGIQFHPERLVGLTWAPTFVGQADEGRRGVSAGSRRHALAAVVVALLLTGCAGSLAPTLANHAQRGLECLGVKSDRPTVILEAGAFGGAADWSLVAARLAEHDRVCAYDRDGIDGQDGADLDRSPVAIARRLEPLVAREAGDAPVILAGHSNGGLYVEAFARLFPRRTAGLLLVDAVGTDVRDHPLALGDLRREQKLAGLAPAARSLGLTGLVPWLDDISPSAEMSARRRRTWTGRVSARAASAEVRALIGGLPAVDALPPLSPSIPVAVIVASRRPDAALDRDWRAAQVAPAGRACRSVVIDAWSSHTSILDAQRDYVVDLVGWLNSGRPSVGKPGCAS